MSKAKIIVTIVVLVVMLAGGGVGLYLVNSPKKTVKSTAADVVPVGGVTNFPDQPAKVADKVYKDGAGFMFSYPGNFTVSNLGSSDASYYSLVSVKSTQAEIRVSVFDTKYITINDWLLKDAKAPKGATLKGSPTLGGVVAKQYLQGGKIYTLALDGGVMYVIEGPETAADAYNKIVSTFAFYDPQGSAPSPAASDTGDVMYEEEVVQ